MCRGRVKALVDVLYKVSTRRFLKGKLGYLGQCEIIVDGHQQCLWVDPGRDARKDQIGTAGCKTALDFYTVLVLVIAGV